MLKNNGWIYYIGTGNRLLCKSPYYSNEEYKDLIYDCPGAVASGHNTIFRIAS